MIKILVTGGTGFVGRELVRSLKKKGNFRVTVFDRSIKSRIPGVTYIRGDITNSDEVTRAVKDQDYVYHLAAVLDEKCPVDTMFNINVGGTVCVLEACRKNKNLKRMIYLSTAGVMAEQKGRINENSPYGPKTRYEKSKALAEKAVLQFRKRHNLPVVVIRPALIYGPNTYWVSILKKVRKSFPIIGPGKNKWHSLYIKNLIPALTKARTKGKDGETYIIADDEAMTYVEMYRIMRQELDVKKEPMHIHICLAKLMAILYSLGNNKSLVTLAHIKRLTKNKWYDISKAKRKLNYKPKYNFNNGIRETIKYLRDEGILKR